MAVSRFKNAIASLKNKKSRSEIIKALDEAFPTSKINPLAIQDKVGGGNCGNEVASQLVGLVKGNLACAVQYFGDDSSFMQISDTGRQIESRSKEMFYEMKSYDALNANIEIEFGVCKLNRALGVALIAAACAFLFKFIACKPKVTAGSPSQSVGEPGAVWAQRVVKVCFMGSDLAPSKLEFSAEVRGWIQAAVSDEFQPEKTGVSFSGWNPCVRNDLSSGVYVARRELTKLGGSRTDSLIVDPLAKGLTTDVFQKFVGDNEFTDGMGSGIWHATGSDYSIRKPKSNERVLALALFETETYCGNVKVPKETCVRGTALHEFGHIVGLRHEHARPEAKIDPNCQLGLSYKPGQDPLGNSANEFVRAAGLPYDSVSMMNYCYMDAYEQGFLGKDIKVGLSKFDRQTLLKLYPGSGTTEPVAPLEQKIDAVPNVVLTVLPTVTPEPTPVPSPTVEAVVGGKVPASTVPDEKASAQGELTLIAPSMSCIAAGSQYKYLVEVSGRGDNRIVAPVSIYASNGQLVASIPLKKWAANEWTATLDGSRKFDVSVTEVSGAVRLEVTHELADKTVQGAVATCSR